MKNTTYTLKNYIYAWITHTFTALGIIPCALSMISLFKNEPSWCIFWLVVAYVIDGLDGTLARWSKVTEVLTNYDGFILDSIIDFISYVFIPVFFIYFYVELPIYLKEFTISFILLTSLYFFFKNDMKTHDYYFNGIPTTWQVIALYLYILTPHAPWTNFTIAMVFCLLQVVNFKFLHPFRVKRFRYFNIFIATLWTIVACIIIFHEPPHTNQIFPYISDAYQITSDPSYQHNPILLIIFALCPIYVMLMSCWRTFEGLTGKVKA